MFHDDGNEVQTLKHRVRVVLGRGLLSQFSPFRYFPHFSLLSKQTLAIEYRVYIWQVSPQLSCGDTCQIWMWFRDSNRYFCKIENFAYGEISERSFSNPHPRKDMYITIEFSYHGLPLLNSVPALVISWYVSFFEWCSYTFFNTFCEAFCSTGSWSDCNRVSHVADVTTYFLAKIYVRNYWQSFYLRHCVISSRVPQYFHSSEAKLRSCLRAVLSLEMQMPFLLHTYIYNVRIFSTTSAILYSYNSQIN